MKAFNRSGIEQLRVLWPDRTTPRFLTRLIPSRHEGTPLFPPSSPSRFCDGHGDYGVLYAGAEFQTIFVEAVLRDRFLQAQPRRIADSALTYRSYVEFAIEGAFELLDLRGDGCTRIGASRDTVGSSSHDDGRELGRYLREQFPSVRGILFDSSFTGGLVCALFDDATDQLEATRVAPLSQHPDLVDTLDHYGIELI